VNATRGPASSIEHQRCDNELDLGTAVTARAAVRRRRGRVASITVLLKPLLNPPSVLYSALRAASPDRPRLYASYPK